jgi:hypothetical protein
MSEQNRAFTQEDTILINDGSPSKALKEQMKKINGLPDNCFTSLPQDEEVVVPISGRYLNVLRQQMAYLLESEETYTVLTALTRIKENFVNAKTGESFKPEQISLFEQALWANMTMISAISAAADQQKKSAVYDKDQFFSSVDQCMKKNAGNQEDINPLNETELAARMGMTVGKDGELHIDPDFLDKQKSSSKYTGATEVDIALSKMGESSETLAANPSKLDGSTYAKPHAERKENIKKKMNSDDD